MKALREFARWLSSYTHPDAGHRLPPGLRLSIHSRSDAHSVHLAHYIVDELLDICPVLREQAARGEVGYGVNYQYRWPNGKLKTLDLAIGIPFVPREPPIGRRIHRFRGRGARKKEISSDEQFSRLLIACELKSVLTEHTKSQPRIFDELNGSHAIVHAGSRDTIAAGIALINIASSLVSPLRQSAIQPVVVT